MIRHMTLALTFVLGLQGAAQAMDVDGATAAAARLLSRNNPQAKPIDLAQKSQFAEGGDAAAQAVQASSITYDDEVVAQTFQIFASENRKLFDLVSVAGRGEFEKQAACIQVNKQIENNKGLYTALTIRPTQITPAGVGLYENNVDLNYIKSALYCP